jgi:hypothetical protein
MMPTPQVLIDNLLVKVKEKVRAHLVLQIITSQLEESEGQIHFTTPEE